MRAIQMISWNGFLPFFASVDMAEAHIRSLGTIHLPQLVSTHDSRTRMAGESFSVPP
jgi:hypothetical protein